MEFQKIGQWIIDFNLGEFDDPSIETQMQAGWIDWFCRDGSLSIKTKRYGQLLSQIGDNGKVSGDMVVRLRNREPEYGPYYDEIQLLDDGHHENDLFICRGNECEEHTWMVYSGRNCLSGPIAGFNTQHQLVAWLDKPWE